MWRRADERNLAIRLVNIVVTLLNLRSSEMTSFGKCLVCLVLNLTTYFYCGVFDKVYGLSFVTEPNKTTMVSTGSNQTFTWQLNLTDQEKSEELKVQFGRWDKDQDNVKGGYLMTFIQKPSANGSVETWNLKRLQWVGDLTRGYFVAFKLFDAELSDSGDYGIRFRVDLFPIKTAESWFTLSVQDPPPLPTKPPAVPKIDGLTVQSSYIEGSAVSITCTASGTPDPDVQWIRNGKVKNSGKNTALLTFSNINRVDGGQYTCRANNSVGSAENHTTLVVHYPPTIKEVTSSADKSWIGQTVSLECVSDGVPTPTLTWYKPDGSQISSVTTTQNPVDVKMSVDQDFSGYKCDADNGLAPANFKIVKIEQIKKPGSPAIAQLDIKAASQPSLTVKWTAPTDDGGSPITAYRVVILKGDTEIKNENITDPAIILLSVGGLERDTKYTVKVFARNAVFEGPAAEKEVKTKYEGNCEDRLTTPCQPYKDAGYCDTYPDSMTYWCEKTCFMCQG